MTPLSPDISRCSNADCYLPCRRKEQGDGIYQSYAAFKPENGKCEYQIKKTDNYENNPRIPATDKCNAR